jgi:hypothetical protein
MALSQFGVSVITTLVLFALQNRAFGENAAPPSNEAVTAKPTWVYVEVAADKAADVAFQLSSHGPFTLLSAEGDCRCVMVTSPVPQTHQSSEPLTVTARITGVLPGIKHLTFRTTVGTVRAEIQVVSGGLGRGVDILEQELALAERSGTEVWLLVDNLRGQARNCGCSAGALGGIDHLAALPAACARAHPGLHLRFLLSGDPVGQQPEPARILDAHGWSRDDGAVVSSADPEGVLQRADAVAVIPLVASAVNNMRLVRPPLDGGMAAVILHIGGGRSIMRQAILPIDATLPVDATVMQGLAAAVKPVVPVADHADVTCVACHAPAAAAWGASAHARAYASLPITDRTNDCLQCHVTASASPIAHEPGVTCTACHQGTAAHADAAGHVRTTGLVDCRSCHDVRHHPGFQHETAWQAILHGR